MTLMDILNNALVGKTIVNNTNPSLNGAKIISISLQTYEPIFEIGIQHPNGEIQLHVWLEDWNIDVE